jgi:hypothetical protein
MCNHDDDSPNLKSLAGNCRQLEADDTDLRRCNKASEILIMPVEANGTVHYPEIPVAKPRSLPGQNHDNRRKVHSPAANMPLLQTKSIVSSMTSGRVVNVIV